MDHPRVEFSKGAIRLRTLWMNNTHSWQHGWAQSPPRMRRANELMSAVPHKSGALCRPEWPGLGIDHRPRRACCAAEKASVAAVESGAKRGWTDEGANRPMHPIGGTIAGAAVAVPELRVRVCQGAVGTRHTRVVGLVARGGGRQVASCRTVSAVRQQAKRERAGREFVSCRWVACLSQGKMTRGREPPTR